MLVGMPHGARLYYKASEQTGVQLCDGAAPACLETTGKVPKREEQEI